MGDEMAFKALQAELYTSVINPLQWMLQDGISLDKVEQINLTLTRLLGGTTNGVALLALEHLRSTLEDQGELRTGVVLTCKTLRRYADGL